MKYRKRNGNWPTVEKRTYAPWDTLMSAVEAWAEAGTDAEADALFAREKSRRCEAERRIAQSAIRYAKSLGYLKQATSDSAQCPQSD